MPSLHSQNDNENGDFEIIGEDQNGRETAEEENTTAPSSKRRKLTRLIIALSVIGFIIFAIVDSQRDNNLTRWTQEFLQWVEDNPVAGIFALVGVYFVATVLFIPGSLLTLGSGFVFANIFGLGLGVLMASIAVFVGASIGAVGSFLLGRYLLRESIQNFSKKYPIFQAIDSALENNGFRIVFLMRLSPIIPFNAINYILGVSGVPLKEYTLSCVGMIPGTVLYVFLGSSAGSIVDSASSGGGNRTVSIISIVLGIVFGIISVAAVTYYAKRELKKIIDDNEESESTDGNNEESVELGNSESVDQR